MLDCNPISTPLDPNQKLTKSQCPTETADIEEMSQKPYMQAVGSLLFAAQLTRLDIAYAVNMLSRFGTNPGKAHWAAVKRVLRYVKGTIDKRLTYQKEHSEVEGYCDADHAGNLDTAQTTTGYVFLLQGGAVSWASKLQKRITLSTTESEFVAMVAASKEATWLKGLQREIFPATPKLTILYCDNKGAENKANNNSYSDATKHVLIKLKYLHQRIKNKELKLVHVSMK
ncbi:uncharacterized protein LOC128861797 [Anastrepha ludens]|uniref:uncharacterized protein LOC128861789 n=1 Tax=Anastrepha ludens TaxID=28586 RepID=UPI0023AFC753|nr:uncharacterized protein LOC128861789 [Anastrepha ludens]XP_053956149.1 uncharacterized protein LOC128861797 [Anastrepha ludens]